MAGHEAFPPDDARAMSPRRSSQSLEKMAQETRATLNEHAITLRNSLSKITGNIKAIEEKHDKLETNNEALKDFLKAVEAGSSGVH